MIEYPPPIRLGKEILEWVRIACEQNPEKIAIDSHHCKIAYRILDEQANQFCNCLISNCAKPGAVISFLIDDPVHLPIWLLGVLRAGYVFAPLDPYSPPRRLEQILSVLQPDMILTSRKILPGLQEIHPLMSSPVQVMTFGEPVETNKLPSWVRLAKRQPENCSTESFSLPVEPDRLSYIFHTSGSTGLPKAIAGRLKGVSHLIRWELETFQITIGCRTSQLISPFFDPYLRDVFIPLCAGGTICIPPERPGLLDSAQLLEWLAAEQIDVVHCVPAMFSAIANAPSRTRSLPNLKIVLLSGETLHTATVRRWRTRFGDAAKIVNLYGATEATMVQLFHVVQDSDLDRGFIPIGRSIEGNQAVLFDENGTTCARGMIGEIGIKSPFLTLGYYHNEEATRALFDYPDSNNAGPPDFYRTGDLVLELEDGNYKLIGRKDTQVKIRGVRVEIEEIEAALLEFPTVAECAIAPRTRADGDLELLAYLKATTQDHSGIPELRSHLRERLPKAMIPAQFVFIDRLPLTANGKVDRAALVDRQPSTPDSEQPLLTPSNHFEARIAEILSNLLGINKIGVNDDFFELGGHSLSAMQLIARLRNEFNIELSVREMFDHPTVAQLARKIETMSLG